MHIFLPILHFASILQTKCMASLKSFLCQEQKLNFSRHLSALPVDFANCFRRDASSKTGHFGGGGLWGTMSRKFYASFRHKTNVEV
jgi:hypothetical protein